jgi:hypothetical protein
MATLLEIIKFFFTTPTCVEDEEDKRDALVSVGNQHMLSIEHLLWDKTLLILQPSLRHNYKKESRGPSLTKQQPSTEQEIVLGSIDHQSQSYSRSPRR